MVEKGDLVGIADGEVFFVGSTKETVEELADSIDKGLENEKKNVDYC